MPADRRAWIKTCLLAGAMTTARGASGQTADTGSADAKTADFSHGASNRPWQIVDTNVSLSRWPFRRIPYDEASALSAKLTNLGIGEAWAGSFDGLFHRDLAGVNARLAETCVSVDAVKLVPFGSVNPMLPDWEEDLRRCQELHGMPGIRLHPGYHGYTLEEPAFARLLEIAAVRGMLVQIAVAMEDRRTQPSALQVPDVDPSPLPDLLQSIPDAMVMLLNYRPTSATLASFADQSRLFFDIARVESTEGIRKLIDVVSDRRVCFGSHAPFLILESAMIKVYESDLTETEVHRLLSDNAIGLREPTDAPAPNRGTP